MNLISLRRAAIAAVAVAALAGAGAAQARHFTKRQLRNLITHSVTGRPVVFGGTAGAAPALALPSASQAGNDLIFHGGSVLHHPKAYLIFYGSQWDSTTPITAGGRSYTLQSAEHYLSSFFAGVGESPWMGVATQYCDNIQIGAVTCAGDPNADYVTNPASQLAGVWVDDSTPAPATIVTSGLGENQVAQDAIATEAEKATLHFGYDPDAVYMVFTPPGTQATLYNDPIGYYCAYHSQASTITRARQVQYAFMPYVPEQGAGCRDNSVYATNDAFGHGYYDSYSITAGHEYMEAVTDPGNYFSVQDGWNDNQTSENGDKCVGSGFPLKPITLTEPDGTTQTFAVQPTWSNKDFDAGNADGGCAFG